MQYQQGDYTVLSASPVDSGRVGVVDNEVPAALRERLVGRRFTRQQLEELGVEFRGDTAIVYDDGVAWRLELSPEL